MPFLENHACQLFMNRACKTKLDELHVVQSEIMVPVFITPLILCVCKIELFPANGSNAKTMYDCRMLTNLCSSSQLDFHMYTMLVGNNTSGLIAILSRYNTSGTSRAEVASGREEFGHSE